MKPTITLSALLLVLAMSFSMPKANAHDYHRNHPVWVDVHHCRVETRHVYFPAYNMYYDMERSLYIYLSGDTWMFSLALPSIYAHIDLAYEPIIELDFYYDRPFIYNEYHVVHYRDYHKHYGRRDYREYGHNHEYYSHTPRHHYKYRDYDGPRHSNHEGNYRNYERNDNGNHNGHYKNGKSNGNGNNKGNYGHNDNRQGKGNYGHRSGGDRGSSYKGGGNHGNGNKGGGNYYKKSSVNTKHVTNGPRGSSTGNGRSSNSRSSNGRSADHRM